MIKGMAQSKRDNAWHNKHLKKLKKQRDARPQRVLNYITGRSQTKRNKKWAMELLEKQREKDLQKNLLQRFWDRVMSFWKLAGYKAEMQIRKAFHLKYKITSNA